MVVRDVLIQKKKAFLRLSKAFGFKVTINLLLGPSIDPQSYRQSLDILKVCNLGLNGLDT